ncbi:hypothetical protein Dda_6959 [Drechslerella dactyloides]|uniref:Uncharacterized protein n=1 Tax=Drechslerella dactyloides TaxID=74499 RepID=A0AAD6ITE5_DREDA|nr:hypothetical protein Dda_6959 [Drechslerella dactyloides]
MSHHREHQGSSMILIQHDSKTASIHYPLVLFGLPSEEQARLLPGLDDDIPIPASKGQYWATYSSRSTSDIEHSAIEISTRERSKLEEHVKTYGYTSLPDPDNTPAVLKFGKQIGLLRPEATALWLRQQLENQRDYSTAHNAAGVNLDSWIAGVQSGRSTLPSSTFLTAQTQYTAEELEQPTGLTLPDIGEASILINMRVNKPLKWDLSVEGLHQPMEAHHLLKPFFTMATCFIDFGGVFKVPKEVVARAAVFSDIPPIIDRISKRLSARTHYLQLRRRKSKRPPVPNKTSKRSNHAIRHRELTLLLREAKAFANQGST